MSNLIEQVIQNAVAKKKNDGTFPIEVGPLVSFVSFPDRKQTLELIGRAVVLFKTEKGKYHVGDWGGRTEHEIPENWVKMSQTVFEAVKKGEPTDNEERPKSHESGPMTGFVLFPKGSLRLWKESYEFRYEAARYFHNGRKVDPELVFAVKKQFDALAEVLEKAYPETGHGVENPQSPHPRGRHSLAIIDIKK